MGRFTYENQGVNTILVYSLDVDEDMDTLAAGMMANNRMEGILSPGFVQKNMTRQLQYDISTKITLKKYLSRAIRKSQLIGIFRSLTKSLMQAENFLLGEESFLLDQEYIYVNEGTADAYLLCFPIAREEEKRIDYYEFIRRLIYEIKTDESEDCIYIVSLMKYINKREEFSFHGFLELLEHMETEQSILPEKKKEQKVSPRPQKEYKPENIVQKEPEYHPLVGEAPSPSQEAEEKKKNKKDKQKKEKTKKKLFQMPFGKKKKQDTFDMPSFEIPGQGKNTAFPIHSVQEKEKSAVFLTKPKNSAPAGEMQTTLLVEEEESTTVLFGEESTTVLIQGNTKRRVTLTQVRNGRKMEVQKEVFCIGRSGSTADFHVADNNTLGRSHADILVMAEGVYIRDNNSLNHTYINEQIVPSGTPMPLSDGDTIRLSDEKFLISIV